jgi:hypothetical protein
MLAGDGSSTKDPFDDNFISFKKYCGHPGFDFISAFVQIFGHHKLSVRNGTQLTN